MKKLSVADEVMIELEGVQHLALIEAIEGEIATVRVLAVTADGETATTDTVVQVPIADISTFDDADESIEADEEGEMPSDEDIEADEALAELDEVEDEDEEADKALDELTGEESEEPQPDEPLAEEEKARFKLGDFVTYESAGGSVTGKVTDIITEGEREGMKATEAEPIVEIEVYEPSGDGMSASGIMTYQQMGAVKMCDEPKIATAKHLPRFAGKLKKAEVTEDVDAQVGKIAGYLSIFENTDLGGDVVKRGAFKRTLDHKGGKIVFMADHGYRTDEVLGVLKLEEDEIGLKMEGLVNLKTDQGRNSFETMKFQAEQGVPLGASIGYELRKYAANATGGYDIQEAELWEGSVTPFPMNTAALITEAYKRYNRNERAKRARLYQSIKK